MIRLSCRRGVGKFFQLHNYVCCVCVLGQQQTQLAKVNYTFYFKLYVGKTKELRKSLQIFYTNYTLMKREQLPTEHVADAENL